MVIESTVDEGVSGYMRNLPSYPHSAWFGAWTPIFLTFIWSPCKLTEGARLLLFLLAFTVQCKSRDLPQETVEVISPGAEHTLARWGTPLQMYETRAYVHALKQVEWGWENRGEPHSPASWAKLNTSLSWTLTSWIMSSEEAGMGKSPWWGSAGVVSVSLLVSRSPRGWAHNRSVMLAWTVTLVSVLEIPWCLRKFRYLRI